MLVQVRGASRGLQRMSYETRSQVVESLPGKRPHQSSPANKALKPPSRARRAAHQGRPPAPNADSHFLYLQQVL